MSGDWPFDHSLNRWQAGLVAILVLAVSISFAVIKDGGEERMIVQPVSSIIINGKSNVNKFRCSSDQYTEHDTLILKTENNQTTFVRGLVRLNASGFDCGMRAMTNDFAETINVEKFPFITINFILFEEIPHYTIAEERFMSKIKLTLASVTKTVEIKCSLSKDDKGFLHLNGERNFTFSDFKLEPPRKMGGLIKVDEKLNVKFHLVLKRV